MPILVGPSKEQVMERKWSAEWWRAVLEASGRQALQAVIPILTLAASGTVAGIDPINVALGVGLAVAVTLARAITGAAVSDTAGPVVKAVDRAVSAAVGAVLALMPQEPLDLLTVEWGEAWTAAAGSAALALVMYWVTPPSQGSVKAEPEPVAAVTR